MRLRKPSRSIVSFLCGVLVLVVIGTVAAERTFRVEPEPGLQWVTQAVFADGRLWLTHSNRSLASLAPDQTAPDRIKSAGRVLAICKSAGRLLAVEAVDPTHWVLKTRKGVAWTSRIPVPTQGDDFVALSCEPHGNRVALITNRRLVTFAGAGMHAKDLRPALDTQDANPTAIIAANAVWLGLNRGEWGGGLDRINLADARVTVVQRNQYRGGVWGGPLDTERDPVNGLVASPGNPSCVIAAIGLGHMGSTHGRIVEVCGETVRRLYFKASGPRQLLGGTKDDEPFETVAFYGLVGSNDAMWAVGMDGLYLFDRGTRVMFRPLPKFEDRGGYRVNFDNPEFVLVLSDINASQAVGGAVPIMVARQ